MGRLLDKLYAASPAFVQSLGITAYSIKQRLTDYGAEFRRYLDEFEKSQWFALGELREYQSEKLRDLVKHCYANVPYYRRIMDESKLKPSDIRSVVDLPKLPILTSEDIRNNYDTLIARPYKPSQLQVGFTSGSTGTPLKLYYDRKVSILKNVVDWRQKRLAGIELGDRLALFWGRILIPGERTRPPFWRYNWSLNHLYCSSYHVSAGNLDAYLEEMTRFGIKAIEGYPSTLHTIARYVLNQKATLPLTAAFTSSETLFPNQREDIESAFGCPVYDYYGMAERVVFGSECDHHQGLHLNMDFGITEILDQDQRPAAPDEVGRIVGTGLFNYGMPLLRYRTSDATSVSSDRCSCGRQFNLMGTMTSRAENIITTPDGRHLSFASLSLPFKQMTSIVEAQIIQEDREHLIINIVKRPTWKDNDAVYLEGEFAKRIGEQMSIELRFVDDIPRTRSGKFKFVISKVPPDF